MIQSTHPYPHTKQMPLMNDQKTNDHIHDLDYQDCEALITDKKYEPLPEEWEQIGF